MESNEPFWLKALKVISLVMLLLSISLVVFNIAMERWAWAAFDTLLVIYWSYQLKRLDREVWE